MKITTFLAPAAIVFLAMPAYAQEAIASFIDSQGTEIGKVTLVQGDGGVTINGDLANIPAGEHGFHFHAVGDCDAASVFESAGDHFNPTDHQHGLANPQGPHAGDLPNLTAADDGIAAVDLTTDMISLTEGDPGYVFDADGTALVVHADPDDMVTDPSGNSGDRIACAVIEVPRAE